MFFSEIMKFIAHEAGIQAFFRGGHVNMYFLCHFSRLGSLLPLVEHRPLTILHFKLHLAIYNANGHLAISK